MQTLKWKATKISDSALFPGWFVEPANKFEIGDTLVLGDERGSFFTKAKVVSKEGDKAFLEAANSSALYLDLLFATKVTITKLVEN